MTDPLAIFTALETLVLERSSDTEFHRLGAAPAWCATLSLDTEDGLSLEAMPFVEAFLDEARAAWRDRGTACSEIWTEIDPRGGEVHLQAKALSVANTELLLVERADALHDTQQLLLQRARALRLTHDALAREVEQKDVLMHCIIHDLQGPLNTILGTLSLFDERALPPELARLSSTAERAALRERELIRDILQVFAAEHESPVANVPMTVIDAAEVAADAAAFLEPAARARGVRLAVTIEGGPLPVRADRSRLLRVVSNLLDNALRHARGLVSLTLSRESRFVVIRVEDDGPGVAGDVGEHLFEKFGRTSGTRGGTGLGLYFCRITVERWGGAIGHEPREGGGARFWVRLDEASAHSRATSA